MDLVLLGDFLERLRKRQPAKPKEQWKDVGAEPEEEPSPLDRAMSEQFTDRPLSMPMTNRRLAYRVAGLIIGIVAAYLAWNCNEGNKSILYRLMVTVLAFFFGLVYIVIYLFLNSEVCIKGRKKN
jgi:hypothetical protein